MKKKKISNWGNYPIQEASVTSSRKVSRLQDVLKSGEPIIARGNGRSYGDAALQKNIYYTRQWNHFLDFDSDKGIIQVEAGVLLSDILDFIVPKGYFLPVTPGTKYITVGGAIASDVHGKNHHKEGSFSNYILEFELLNEKGEILQCSPNENAEIFWATIGGMGLTGIILTARFELKKIETSYIRNESIQAKNLDELFQLMEESESWTYTVAWVDCFQQGDKLGRGLMMRGEHALKEDLDAHKKKKPLALNNKKNLSVPFYFPDFVLKKWSMRIFNFLFYHKQGKKKSQSLIHFNPFFYPLDAINDWNKIYGKSGFIQYQFVIPKEKGKEGMRKILETISKSGNGSFLVVLKLFGSKNPLAYNSFPEEGYTLALDFKINENLPQLIQQLDDLVEEYGGKIYRAKDAMSRASLTNYLENIDSEVFDSVQNQRIKQQEKS